jgi:hypothetical protein
VKLLTKSLQAKAFFWFGFALAIFGVATQFSNNILLVPPSFYLQLSITSFLAGIYTLHEMR